MFNQKGQIQVVIIGVVAILAVVGIYFGFTAFKKSGGEQPNEKEIPAGSNVSATPVRSNLSPSGILLISSRGVKLSLSTDRPAYCRYSTVPGKEYINMSDGFDFDDDKLQHTVTIRGLASNKSYKYYVRCKDVAGNTNEDDASIAFSIGNVAAGQGSGLYYNAPPEAPPIISNLLPSGNIPSGNSKTTLSLKTNEPAYCRYATMSGKEYINMSDGFDYDDSKLQHTVTVSGLSDNKVYEYYIRCKDLNGNANNDDAVIRFSVGGSGSGTLPSVGDTTAPNRFNASPSKDLPTGTFQTNLSLETDEKAVCRYGTVAGENYESMQRFANTDSAFHSTPILGLNEGGSYKYYIKCADQKGNKNASDLVISFKVEATKDATPPVLSSPSHNGNVLPSGTTQAVISISTNEVATCKYSITGGTSYSSMSGSFSYYNQTKKFHVKTITGLQNGNSYDFFARCQDSAGNINAGDVLINFSVQ